MQRPCIHVQEWLSLFRSLTQEMFERSSEISSSRLGHYRTQLCFGLRGPVFVTLIDGSGFFTAEKIARATRSGLASIRGIGFGGRPRGRTVIGFFVMATTLCRAVWLGNW